jgi:3'(2'), 5'-bisphosphate nucleotidase
LSALGQIERIACGSSLKLCRVAEGAADFYPRFGPTMEWDTAAAQCVVEVAGGMVADLSGVALRYNKQNLLNPYFMVAGLPSFPWQMSLRHPPSP